MKNSLAKPCAVIVAVAAISLFTSPDASAMRRPQGVPDTAEKQGGDNAKTAKSPDALAENTASPQAEAAPPPAARNAQVTVLGYHRFVKTVRHPDTEITAEDFEKQMQALKDQGITVISLSDFLAWKAGKKEIPAQSALITFDDGWRSQYEIAWPILKKFNYPLTSFVYIDYIKGGKRTGGESMSWEELAEMRDGGVDIQSHTVSHSDLRGKKGIRNTPEYDKWLWDELAGSKAAIEEHLGVKVTALALPYGFYNAKVQEVAKKAGYEAIFTVYGQKITFRTPLDTIGRTIIESNKPKLFTTATHFSNSGSGGGGSGPAIAEVSAQSLAPKPADGTSVTEAQPEISANLKSFGNVKPDSVMLRISGIGSVKGNYDPVTQTVTYRPSRKLADNNYTVIVSAEANGRRQEARWKFTVGSPKSEQDGAAPSDGEMAKTTPKETNATSEIDKANKTDNTAPEAVGEETDTKENKAKDQNGKAPTPPELSVPPLTP